MKKHRDRKTATHKAEAMLPLISTEAMNKLPKDARYDSLWDRRMPADSDKWHYKCLMRDGSMSDWEAEAQVRKSFTTAAVDSFHSLFELRHDDQIPRHAQRKADRGTGKALTAEQAMAKYPKGTLVAREGDVDEGQQRYIKGRIRGYLQPWWRAIYDDDILEDLTATEVRRGIEMRKQLDERVLNASGGDEIDVQGVFTDALQWFEPSKEAVRAGMTMRIHLPRGWCKGVVKRTYAPSASRRTLTVTTQVEGDHGPRDIRLLRENCGDNVNCKIDTWHFTRPTTTEADMDDTGDGNEP
jgi:hypothetical protein